MYSVANSLRDVQSAGSQFEQSISPYARSARPGTTGAPDKNTIIWKDFLHSANKRKGMLKRLREAALGSGSDLKELKKMLLDIRSTTVKLIEDALQIEYISRMSNSDHSKRSFKFGRLPPITSFKAMEDKEDLFALVEIIDDVDDLFSIPNIKVMLPMVFPNHRNPFMLGKTIDELAVANIPRPQPGNVDEEMKVMELLQYKRVSRALLRAEAQMLNRLPIDMVGLERLLERMKDDFNLDKMFRSVCTILDNDTASSHGEANLTCLLSPVFNVEAHDILTRLNQFRGAQPMRIDVQVAIRQRLRECSFEYLEDSISKFLLEWMELVLNATQAESKTGSTAEFRLSSAQKGGGLASIQEAAYERENSPQRAPSRGVAMELSSMDFDKTHENITITEAARKKMQSPSQKSRPGTTSAYRSTSPPHRDMAVGDDSNPSNKDTSISPDRPSGRKPLKKKVEHVEPPVEVMTEFNSSSAPPAIIRKKIRIEVERAVRELGLNKLADEEGRGGNENISSLRYEVQKMQQELLRRHVLDPRHYVVSSVDAVTHAQQGLTVPGMNAFDPFSKRKRARAEEESVVATPVLLGEKTILLPGKDDLPFSVTLTVTLDFEQECLIGKVIVSLEDAQKYKLLDDSRPLPASMKMSTATVIAHATFSKLIYSMLAELKLEDLIAAKPANKVKMISKVFDEMEAIARAEVFPRGEVTVNVNRVLFANKFSEDNVLVDLVISRNVQCDGLSIYCTPLAGLFHSQKLGIGPVVINVNDNELEVLLINQHGLFKQAMTKWSSLKMLSQWLASQIKVRKVPAASYVPSKTIKLIEDDAKEDDVSATSQITYTPRRNEFASTEVGGEVAVKEASTEIINPNTLLLLEVTLNRKLQISALLLEHWKSRNLPKIVGLECVLEAVQDLEVLSIGINITVPSKKAYKKLINDSMKQESLDLVDLDDFSDDEGYGEEDSLPTKVGLTFQLTRQELLIFGYAPSVDSKSVAMTKSNDKDHVENHPESLMWNVLSRLKVHFKGSKVNPYKTSSPASDPNNWSQSFERLLVRDVRTISQNIFMVSAQAVGGEILLEPKPVNSSANKELKVAAKRLTEAELIDVVQTEGWPLKMLGYENRKDLVYAVLDKLKVVVENDKAHLELSSYVETKMITISRVATAEDFEAELGCIEINNQQTLSDLRILIKHELDPDELPNQFRFLYKGVMCSIRQEVFRRAWECLPTCFITPKMIESQEMGTETDDIAQKRLLTKAAPKKEVDSNAFKMVKGQRRVPGKYNPVPLPTLCVVHEGKPEIYLLHDGKDLLVPGDIIRIGNVLGRDYLVSAVGSKVDQFTIDSKVIFIDPEYDLANEPDFNLPIQNNCPWPAKSNGVYMQDFVKPVQLLKSSKELGYSYALPEEFAGQLEATAKWLDKVTALDPTAAVAAGGDDDAQSHGHSATAPPKKPSKKLFIKRAFTDCWIWKCIPAKDDNRPKWRQLYDDGLVHYTYEMRGSDEFVTYYRVPAHFSYLEVLCTDSRVPSLSHHHQRVNEMRNIPLEFYLRTAFDKLTEWTPVYRKGIDRSKFIKLIRDVNAFPDLKRPARVAQLDMIFQKLVKSDFGIVQKYISFPGFCQLLKETALIRFPAKRKKGNDDDASSVGSLGGAGTKKKGKDDDESSMMTDDLSSIGDEPMASPLKRGISRIGSTLSKKPSQQSLSRAPSSSNLARKGSVLTKKGSSTLKNIIEEETPSIDPEHIQWVYQKFVLDFIMMFPNWYDAAWKEAKMAAMRKEAIPYCAATRIAASMRGFVAKSRLHRFLKHHIKLQANIRRKLSAQKTETLKGLLYEDWWFRRRFYFTTRINAWIRRFLKRCWYLHVLEQIKRQQIIVLKARRQRLKKIRLAEKKTVIYSEAVRVNGVMVFITLTRKDPRNYTKDYGINIEVYAPVSQTTFRFTLEDTELRSYMAIELQLDVVTVGQIMDIRNLKRLMSSRLIVHKGANKSSAPLVILSKHALGQRGEKALTRAKRINGHLFICKIFETVDDIAVQCYHQISCKIFTCKMTMKEMRGWIKEEFLIECKDEAARFADPPLLHPKNKRNFHAWVLDHLVVDTRHGMFRVLFACHLLKSKKGEMILRIQSVWRRALVRPTIIRMLDAVMIKIYATPGDTESAYYLNRLTGASSWEKPTLLAHYDLPTVPTSRWVDIWYYDEQGTPHMHYVNPYTGKYTNLVPEKAARTIQALARNHLLKTISMPLKHFVKAGQLFKTAERKYGERSGGGALKLSAVVNFALMKHVITLEEDEAKELYRQAVELSEANPLVTRAYAFFLLGTCPAPLALNRERALVLLRDADRKDPEMGSFGGAYYIFQFACLRKPFDVRTLLNLALVQCYLYSDTKSYVAEKLLRRALALAPFDERVMEIWKLLRDRFPERQLLYSSMMRRTTTVLDPKLEKRKMVHGRDVIENRLWAGWCYVEKDTFNVSKKFAGIKRPYWYNPATGEEMDVNPDFNHEWEVRKARSILQESTGTFGLQAYYDPLTADYFECFTLTNTYQ